MAESSPRADTAEDGARRLAARRGGAADRSRVPERQARLTTRGLLLAGPRLVAVGDRALAVWVEDPKVLVVARLDARGAVEGRVAFELPEVDASVVDLAPLVRADGVLGVALLERGLRRPGEVAPVRRLAIRWLGPEASPGSVSPPSAARPRSARPAAGAPAPARRDAAAPGDLRPPPVPLPEPRLPTPGTAPSRSAVQVIAEAPEDDFVSVPTAIVSAGLYTSARLPAVVWRRSSSERGREARPGPAVLSVVRPEGIASSDMVVDPRTASAIGWRSDGTILVGGSDAGRPFVIESISEDLLEVPTPAVLSSVLPLEADLGWLAAGVDGSRHLFVVPGDGSEPRGSLLPVAPLAAATPDLADSGISTGAPLLAPAASGVRLLWPARVGAASQIRARPIATDARPAGPSTVVLRCPPGTRVESPAVASVGSRAIVAAACVSPGRADVHVAPLPP